MSDKYKEAMDNIHVTKEMHERVMSRVRASDTPSKKVVFPRKIAAIAACAVVLAAGAAGIAIVSSQSGGTTYPPTLYQDTEQYSDAAALSSALGFDISDLSDIPFEVDEAVYSAISGNIADITYYGKNGESLTYRVSRGNDDNSGYFGDFEREDTFEANGKSVTLKGANEGYTLAVWRQNSLSYSVSVSYPTDSQTLLSIIK